MAATRGNIKADQLGIGSVLQYNQLLVPPNQREYAWEEEHVNDLFQDFAGAIESNSSYFLGAIVLTEGERDHPEVSDGQQRLATTSILLAAIRDYFLEQKEEDLARSIENDFLLRFDREARENLPRLTLNIDDREFFLNTILVRPEDRQGTDSKKDSHSKLLKAKELATKFIKSILKPHRVENQIDTLNRWIKFIQNKAQVILLLVPDDIDAYQMFETLNGRGLHTSQADLIKNYLFKRAGNERIIEAQDKWGTMNGALESLGEEEITLAYLRHLLQTQHGPTKERELLDRVKNEITSQPKATNFLELLSDSANEYVAMLNPAHTKWDSYGDKTRASITTIHQHLQVKQIRPLMFAVTKYFQPRETEKAFRMLISWSVRFLIVGGRGGLLDRNYAVSAQKIGSGSISTAEQLAQDLEEILPPDTTFRTAFSETRVSKSHLARYYLRALETKITGQPEPELLPNEDSAAITLEHILPEVLEDQWPAIDPETAKAYYKRLGNMVLLKANVNSKIGNKPFSVKKPYLAQSAYILTKKAGEELTWDVNTIVKQQKYLASLAVETWPLRVR